MFWWLPSVATVGGESLTAAEPIIRANGLTKKYGEATVVDAVDLVVQPGEVFGLLGPNGAGKTTTILMMLGLSEPSAGTVKVCGFDPTRDPLDVKRRVGYLPDRVGFYDDITGRQNLRYTAALNRLPNAESEARIDELLEEVGLTDAGDQPVGTYSRGMRQRLGIADTLVKNPTVVILDEPTAAIDPFGVVEIHRLIRGLTDSGIRTVLLASHLLHQAQEICDRVGIFVAGKIVAQGSPAELSTRLGEGRSLLEVDIDGDRASLQRAVTELGGEAVPATADGHSGKWRVSVPPGSAPDLVQALVASGVRVRQVRDKGSDLDEIYRRYFALEEVVS